MVALDGKCLVGPYLQAVQPLEGNLRAASHAADAIPITGVPAHDLLEHLPLDIDLEAIGVCVEEWDTSGDRNFGEENTQGSCCK